MQIRGSVKLPSSAQGTWEALTDPAILQRCIAGCETFVRTTPTSFAATVRAKVGPIRARIRVDIALLDAEPPNAWSLEATAQSPIGAATATTAISLTEHEDGTKLSYAAKATLGGKLALFAGRWSDQAVQVAMKDFFLRLSDILCESATANGTGKKPSDLEAAVPMAVPEEPSLPPPKSRTKLWVGVGSVAAVATTIVIAAVWRRR